MQMGVVGAGVMGSQIALLAALSGHNVVLWNHKKRENVAGSLRRVGVINIRLGLIAKDELDSALARITYTQSLEDLAYSNLVLEAVSEDYSIKAALIKGISDELRTPAIISTNSSTVSTSLLAASSNNPSRFIGLHFFNPPFSRDLVEIIRAEQTSEETVRETVAFCQTLKRRIIVINESPGFVVNRVLFPMINEAIFLLAETNIGAKEIDSSIKRGTGNPMGPLELADFIGLDVCLSILENLALETGDQKYRPAPLLRRMVRAGKCGKKSGAGFYSYRKDQKDSQI